MIVGAGEEPHRLATQPPVPGQDVGLHQLQRMPQVRLRVDVRDRRRDVEVAVGRHGPAFPPRMRRRPQQQSPRAAGACRMSVRSAHAEEPRERAHHSVQWLVHAVSVARRGPQDLLIYRWLPPVKHRRRRSGEALPTR